MQGAPKENGNGSGPKMASDMPRHRAIYEALLEEIESGQYKPGERLPSEAALCERFDSSRITVAKALQTLQRDQLVTRRPGSGTYVQQPPAAEPSLKFGLLIPDLGTTDIFEPICQGIMRSPAAKSHSLTWGHSTGETDKEIATEQLCRQYIGQKVDGVFFAPSEYSQNRDAANQRIVTMLEEAGIPIVLLDRCLKHYPDRSHLDLVGIDNHRAGFMVTRHLWQAGARRIVFASRPNSAPTVEARSAGYRNALHSLADGARGVDVSGDFDDPTYVESMLKEHRPDGIVCGNDLTAARLMQTIVGLGVSVPGDVRMVGFDDVSYAKFLPTPLTTIRQDCGEIGSVAMSTMLERLRRPHHVVRDVLVRTELIVRRSSGAEREPEPDFV